MRIESVDPKKMIVLDYRQDRTDKDYGTCLWARFYFDTEEYELLVDSDCGSGATNWVPTPKFESFMELMGRIGGDEYLLQRLFGAPTEVDTDCVVENVREFMMPEDEDVSECYRERCEDALDILAAAILRCEAAETVIRILDEWNEELDDDMKFNDTYYLYDCASPVYTAWQKRVVQVFYEHIQPYIRKRYRVEDCV